MRVVQPISTAQDVSVVARPSDGSGITTIVKEEGGSIITSVVNSATTSGSYLTINLTADFKDNTFYQLRIFANGIEVHRGLVFSTSKTDIEHISIYDKTGNYIDV